MKIAVTRLSTNDKIGTPKSFEAQYEKRSEARRRPATPRPKLAPIENPTLQERMEDFGIGDR